jgi:hypothetical protein
LEKIPYLEGCIKEALRQMSPVAAYLLYNEPTDMTAMYRFVGNMARCSPDVSIEYTIPRNVCGCTDDNLSLHSFQSPPLEYHYPQLRTHAHGEKKQTNLYF